MGERRTEESASGIAGTSHKIGRSRFAFFFSKVTRSKHPRAGRTIPSFLFLFFSLLLFFSLVGPTFAAFDASARHACRLLNFLLLPTIGESQRFLPLRSLRCKCAMCSFRKRRNSSRRQSVSFFFYKKKKRKKERKKGKENAATRFARIVRE